MNYEDLQTLVDYHYWARDRVLDAVEPLSSEQFTRDLGNSFPSIRDTVVHLYGADGIWCSRVSLRAGNRLGPYEVRRSVRRVIETRPIFGSVSFYVRFA